MTLRLPDKWVWDFWLVRDGTDYHAFYLQAPRSLGDPELRHLNASIGHAASKDLRHWRILPDALSADPPGVWDDRDRKSTRLNSSHANISYAVFCLKKKTYTPLNLHNYMCDP